MKLLAFGQTGQVARELEAVGVQTLGREEADLTDPAKCAALVAATDADAVINAAAYTAVDKAEEDEDTALTVNGDAPTAMAQACAAKGIPLVHISTDYVFEGSGTDPWHPDDTTGPLGAYGRTKLAGEEGVRRAGGTYAILRTSWVFSAHGGNFVKTMLRVGPERGLVRVVDDQIGGPTPSRDIAKACVEIAKALVADPGKSGTYHFSSAPDVSWAEFAVAVFQKAGVDCTVEAIPTSEYPLPAARPSNSRMDCSTTEATFGIKRPDWRVGLDAVLADLSKT